MRQLAIILALSGLLPVVAAAAPGDLDPSFGNGGIVIGPAASDPGVAVALQADRKVIALTRGGVFARYDVNGAPDPSFGSGGTIPSMYAVTMAIDQAGRLVSTGYVCSDTLNICNIVTRRYLPDGSPDTTFGNGGSRGESFGAPRVPGSGAGTAVTIQPDGKILVGGFATENQFSSTAMNFVVFRYDENGTHDPAFASGRYATASFGTGPSHLWDVTVQPDGKIVAVGEFGNIGTTGEIALARWLADGTLDPSFGSGGTVTTTDGQASHIALQSSGRILVAGLTSDAPRTILLRAYAGDGSVDGTFGNAGRVTTAVGSASSASGIAVRHDDVITLSAVSDASAGFVVALYDADGALEPAFGSGGIVTTPIGSAAAARSLALQPDGTIVVGGTSDNQLALARYQSTAIGPYCGDGIVNGSEQCDEGAANGHVSCCASDCTLRGAGLVCRPAVNACDAAEQCDGSSSACPSDAQLPDGTPCDDGSLCTTGDVCSNHVCGGTPVTCATCQACNPSSGTCAPADGAPCDDGDACTTNDTCSSGTCGGTSVTCPVCETCDTAVGCVAAPRDACTLPPAGQSTLTIAQGTSPANARLLWKWGHGQTTAASFGDPTTSDDYAFCIYGGTAQSPSVVFGARIPAGGLCVGVPCWKALGTPPGAKGFKYHYKYRRPDGIDKLVLKPGDGNAKLSLKGAGVNLTIPPLPPTLPLRAQLQGPAGACWDADYSVTGLRKPGPPKFKARSD